MSISIWRRVGISVAEVRAAAVADPGVVYVIESFSVTMVYVSRAYGRIA